MSSVPFLKFRTDCFVPLNALYAISAFWLYNSLSNCTSEDVNFQNTNLPGEILEYKPKFEGEDVDLEGARRDLEDMMIIAQRKEEKTDKQKKVLENLFMKETELQQELINTPVWNLFGRTQAVVAREKANIARDIRAEQREYKKLVTEYTELINETKEQADRIVVIQANIKDNEKEKSIIDKKNKDTIK